MSRIFVTGMGVFSAIGNNLEENRQSLIRGHSGIGPFELFPSRYAGLLPSGEIKMETRLLSEQLHACDASLTRTMLLAQHAFNEAIADASLPKAVLTEPGTALIGASTVGGMCLTDEMQKDSTASTGGSPYLTSYDGASVFLYLQRLYKIGGIINTINTACSSSANAVMYGARLIRHGLAKRVIAGGADSLAKFTINGFNALRILSSAPCRPFDEARNGLNLGEGAAFLVLEKEEDIGQKKVYAELTGYGNANDAFHPSSLSEAGVGPFVAMESALRAADLEPQDIGFINAHGTATENNDEVESMSMVRLFGKVPPFVSTKANTGHTLGAAGAIESVFSICNLYYQELFPALHFSKPITPHLLVPELNYTQMNLAHVMSNSFGFGGNCTSLVFSKA